MNDANNLVLWNCTKFQYVETLSNLFNWGRDWVRDQKVKLKKAIWDVLGKRVFFPH